MKLLSVWYVSPVNLRSTYFFEETAIKHSLRCKNLELNRPNQNNDVKYDLQANLCGVIDSSVKYCIHMYFLDDLGLFKL